MKRVESSELRLSFETSSGSISTMAAAARHINVYTGYKNLQFLNDNDEPFCRGQSETDKLRNY